MNDHALALSPQTVSLASTTASDVLVARIKARERKAERQAELLKAALTNPIIELAMVVALSSIAEKAFQWTNPNAEIGILGWLGEHIFGVNQSQTVGAITFSAGAGIIMAQQIAPYAPALIQASGGAIKDAGSLLSSIGGLATIIPK